MQVSGEEARRRQEVVKAPCVFPFSMGSAVPRGAEWPCCYKSPQHQPSFIHTAVASALEAVTPRSGLQEDTKPYALCISVIRSLPRGKEFEAWICAS